MTDRRAARTAWVLSAGLHGLAVAGFWALVTSPPPAEPSRDIAFGLVEPDQEVPAAVAPAEPTGRPPTVVPIPAALPPTAAAFVRERADRPAVEDVTDVQQVSATQPTVADRVAVSREAQPSATPAGVASTATNPIPGVPPLHGPLPAGRVVVYVLDCSGTMGLGGKLNRARTALAATLAGQPARVRALVVTYSGRAEPLTPGGPAEVTPLVRERIADALAKLEPAGESRHAEGVRVAVKFAPDYVVLLTDADDAELVGVGPAAAGARKPVSVRAARVSAEGVEPPRPIR